MPGLKDKITDVGYGAGWSLVCRLPEHWTAWAFRFFADLAWRRQGPRVQVLEANLVRVLGPDTDGKALRAASRQVMRNYGRYWLEIFRLPMLPVDRLVDGMYDPDGAAQAILETVAAGRGLVIALPHMGNWDQAGAWIITKGAGSFTTVQERLKPESLYERFVTFREGLGMEVLPASGGVRPFGILAQRLRAGKIVILPADRDVTGSGIEVEFFGEKAKMMAGSAALAVLTGAPLIPATLVVHRRRLGRPHRQGDHAAGRGHQVAEDRRGHAGRRQLLRDRASGSIRTTGSCCRRSSSPTWTRTGRPRLTRGLPLMATLPARGLSGQDAP